MEHLKIAKQFIDFQAEGFDKTFNAMLRLQEQTGKIAGSFLTQCTSVRDEGQKAISSWIGLCRDENETLNQTVLDMCSKTPETGARQWMDMMRRQADLVAHTVLDETTKLTKDGQKMLGEWMAFCKKEGDDFKKQMESLLDTNSKDS